ncbi:uncharacterized protein MAM_06413 [Metarhizium album ARSEF 1941]|uniref:Uncharacterized protein n=1 Tax=Metarhizium album (strain ARSEF 1941) TaxID=1081103 RepID=A0A0B2WIE8_METAS|nr:uncharacterized protein MAM_06413 [Metarhizium album ARSEF 1941]KHN95801.1 hypothetical protein MAM_06413 [Metarhizium album ARSEF 1941]
MSSRRRRHSGPPPHDLWGASPADDEYWRPSGHPARAEGAYAHTYKDGLPPPQPPYEPPCARSETWPDGRRGRLGERQRGHGRVDLDDGREPRIPRHASGSPSPHGRASRRHPSPGREGRSPRGRSGAPRARSTPPSAHAPRKQRLQTAASQWWQNPVVRTCAITALSTGLTAALDSRGDPGPWKGAKGAKVAVASLGSALVDGFLGHKHPNSVRQEVVRKGVEVAMEETEKKKKKRQPRGGQDGDARRPGDHGSHGRHRHGRASRSHGRRG